MELLATFTYTVAQSISLCDWLFDCIQRQRYAHSPSTTTVTRAMLNVSYSFKAVMKRLRMSRKIPRSKNIVMVIKPYKAQFRTFDLFKRKSTIKHPALYLDEFTSLVDHPLCLFSSVAFSLSSVDSDVSLACFPCPVNGSLRQ